MPLALSGVPVYRVKFLMVSAEFSSPSRVRMRVSMTTSSALTLRGFLEEALSAGGGVEWWPGGELVVVQVFCEGRVWLGVAETV